MKTDANFIRDTVFDISDPRQTWCNPTKHSPTAASDLTDKDRRPQGCRLYVDDPEDWAMAAVEVIRNYQWKSSRYCPRLLVIMTNEGPHNVLEEPDTETVAKCNYCDTLAIDWLERTAHEYSVTVVPVIAPLDTHPNYVSCANMGITTHWQSDWRYLYSMGISS